MKKFEILFVTVKVPIDILMSVLGFLTAYKLRIVTQHITTLAKPIDYSSFPSIKEYLEFATISSLFLVLILTIEKTYQIKTTLKLKTEINRILKACVIWIMATITYFFFMRTFAFSRLTMIYSWTLASSFIIFGRIVIKQIQKKLLSKKIGRRNLVFIGKNEISKKIEKALKKTNIYNIIGHISPQQIEKDLDKILKKHEVDAIIQTDSENASLTQENILSLCDLKHISYRIVPDIIKINRKNIEIENVDEIPVIHLKATPLDGWNKVIKRILDIIGATTALILFSPIMLITAIAIKIDSKGTVLFTHLDNGDRVKRVGQHGKLINFYKFRSMKPNTDSQRYTILAHQNTRKNTPLVKIQNDPRVTRVGKFIRKSSIDELPQLISVLRGTMSLVGPRPHLPEEVSKYKNHERFVLTVKPGITGLAQTNGRSNLEFEKEIELDKKYIENWSIWADIKIILKTFIVIFKGYKE